MNAGFAFDLLLAALLLWSAWRALATPRLDRAIVLFIAFGLLMALVWARVDAPDIALAEAAIGAGITGALLLDALGAWKHHAGGGKMASGVGAMQRAVAGVAALVLAVALIAAMLTLPPAAVSLPPLVAAKMEASGVAHPVTAVLLNFRGYDTLLEVAVLLLALLGVLAVGREAGSPHSVRSLGVEPVVATLARLGVPLMLLVGVYLLWAGAHRPGGAFQAAAVIAAAAVLLNLARLTPAWTQAPGLRLRWGLAGGLLVFVGVAAALLSGGALLLYPPAQAGLFILAIESALTVSLGLILAGFFLFLSADRGGQA